MKWVYLILGLPALALGCIRAHDVYVVLSGVSADFSPTEAGLEAALLLVVGIVFFVRAVTLFRSRSPASRGFPIEAKHGPAES